MLEKCWKFWVYFNKFKFSLIFYDLIFYFSKGKFVPFPVQSHQKQPDLVLSLAPFLLG